MNLILTGGNSMFILIAYVVIFGGIMYFLAIRPQRNEVGEWGLTRYDLRKLHHTLYHEDRKNSSNQKDEEPWA